MNHRWASRNEVNIDVMVYRKGLSVARCKASDISRDGMFIKTGPLSYRQNSSLEVALISSDAYDDEARLQAIVVHSNDNGMGLMFRYQDFGAMPAFKDVLFANQQPRQAIAAGMSAKSA